MKSKIAILAVIITALMFTGCSNTGNDTQRNGVETKQVKYENISPEDAKQRLDNEKGIILLDVRTQEEYDEKHIPDSILIPVDEIEEDAPAELADKDATIFVYCRSGNRSVTASEVLVKMGYTKIYNLGGIIDWPYETETVK